MVAHEKYKVLWSSEKGNLPFGKPEWIQRRGMGNGLLSGGRDLNRRRFGESRTFQTETTVGKRL